MTLQKYYAVRHGRKPGIYLTWPECKKQVEGFTGARYKSFPDKAQAQAFLDGKDSYSKKKTTKQKVSNIEDFDIVVYTDGGSRNHGNVKGGHVKDSDRAAWAYHINNHGQVYEGTDGEFGATNNRMEIMALIQSIKRLNELKINQQNAIFVLDSQYVLNAITKNWLNGWKRRGFKKADGKVVANVELWRELDQLLPTVPKKTFEWTKGHAENVGNNRVDQLLNETMDKM
ncbi:ribonuclease H family protein [Companilactobacillus alimentarius]|uniref:Ribonuclease H n=1 Tax=Companilactobacillus alimentarius DSM 20249 TaxID=1423720 RepID=A0A2K9HJL1_9LACO|nr:ribonuclease H family protein [Companilactobacillus alimentarius]AUI71956.1 RNase HI [Companilactobacillus alimentarius DSM 20249]KRK77902.1 RNase H [Companilactobacillus alimentarius DSM 20249]MDT6952484.1 ribonuclease H family protein [Companilactobacillus alimentarius]